MRVVLLPIEPFEERYTADWRAWFPSELQAAGLEVAVIDGDMSAARPRASGEFLDVTKTWLWKGSQVANVARFFETGGVRDGDVFLSLDGWGPATEEVAYIRDALKLPVKLAVFMHAGSYDPWDFLHRVGMERWAEGLERGWMQAADLVLLGSQFHAELLTSTRGLDPSKAAVVGVPVHLRPLLDRAEKVCWERRRNLVVFPHRIAPEKAPEEFDWMERRFKERYPELARMTTWVKTRDSKWAFTEFDGYTSKTAYCQLLGKARCVVSTARQETFGIAMQEGAALGAWVVAPRRLSYPDVVHPSTGWLYDSLDEAVDQVARALFSPHGPEWPTVHEDAIGRCARALLARCK